MKREQNAKKKKENDKENLFNAQNYKKLEIELYLLKKYLTSKSFP
jgi:hypothetical protein